MRLAIAALLLLLAAACKTTVPADRFLEKYAAPDPELSRVVVCHGYGCRRQDVISLRADWAALTEAFAVPAADAEAERQAIATTIARIEQTVGPQTGTGDDLGGTFSGTGQSGQLDCIDETANTTTYLVLLEREGLLRFHETRAPMSRGFFVNGWPHTTAVIAETGTERLWVVDSWFHGNGVDPEILPLDDWVDGWDPVATAPAVVDDEATDDG